MKLDASEAGSTPVPLGIDTKQRVHIKTRLSLTLTPRPPVFLYDVPLAFPAMSSSPKVLGDVINNPPRILITNIQVSFAPDCNMYGYSSGKLVWTASQAALAEVAPGLCEYSMYQSRISLTHDM